MNTVSQSPASVQTNRPEPITVGSIWREPTVISGHLYYQTFRVAALADAGRVVFLERVAPNDWPAQFCRVADAKTGLVRVPVSVLLTKFQHATDRQALALRQPHRFDTVGLDVLRSDANGMRAYDEEEAFAELVRQRDAAVADLRAACATC